MSLPAVPTAPESVAPGALRVTVDAMGISACIEALCATPTPISAVEIRVVRALGQSGDYVWLGFVTHHPNRGWERNGIAAQSPGMVAGRSIVVDIHVLAAAIKAHPATATRGAIMLDWAGDGLQIGSRVVPATHDEIPPVPDVPAVRDAVYLSGSSVGDVVVESEQGRICLPAALVTHLHQRGAVVAELGILDGDVFVVAQSERRGEASIDPVIVAPVPLLMWSDDSVRADFQERRRQGGSEVEQLLAALDPTTPVPMLLELLDTGVAYVRRRVAAHPALPCAITDALAGTGTQPMRIAVAANRSLSPTAVSTLVDDVDPLVRAELARNPALLAPVVEQLARDTDADVRAAVAVHPALSPQVRAVLAQDPGVTVRRAVAGDPASGSEIVRQLLADVDPGVRRAAAANPACPPDVLEQIASEMPHAVLANPSAPAALLAAGARNVDGALRAMVAANPSTPGRVLTSLSRDPDARVLRAVATNACAPAPARRRARKRVMTDGEAIVASAARGSEN